MLRFKAELQTLVKWCKALCVFTANSLVFNPSLISCGRECVHVNIQILIHQDRIFNFLEDFHDSKKMKLKFKMFQPKPALPGELDMWKKSFSFLENQINLRIFYHFAFSSQQDYAIHILAKTTAGFKLYACTFASILNRAKNSFKLRGGTKRWIRNILFWFVDAIRRYKCSFLNWG